MTTNEFDFVTYQWVATHVSKGCVYYTLGINDLVLYLGESLVIPCCLQRSSDLFKVWLSRSLAVGWPACPGLPGAFLVEVLKVLHPGNSLISVQTGTVGHSAFGISSLRGEIHIHPHLPPSSFALSVPFISSYLSHRLAILFPISLLLSMLPSAWEAPLTFCCPQVWFSSGMVC